MPSKQEMDQAGSVSSLSCMAQLPSTARQLLHIFARMDLLSKMKSYVDYRFNSDNAIEEQLKVTGSHRL